VTAKTESASVDYIHEIARIVNEMPLREVAQVYEFVVSLQTQSETSLFLSKEDDEGWLSDSEEDLLAEDHLWDEMLARHADVFDALASAAEMEIKAGLTQPMFGADGELRADELPHDA
jgi:hypothetical protein